MTLSYHEDPDARLVEFRFSGHLTREEFESVTARMQEFIDAHKPIRLLEIVESFDGFEPGVIWPGIKFDLRNIRHISHVAVVTDVGWISPMSRAAGALISTRLRTFELSQEAEARAWLAEVTDGADTSA